MSIKDYRKRLWIAHAPIGQWSSGPVVMTWAVLRRSSLEEMAVDGWLIEGPYVLEEETPEETPEPWCTCGAKTPQGQYHKAGCPAKEATRR